MDDEELDDYIILDKIGKGNGQNLIYKVKHLEKNKVFALKKIVYDKNNKADNERTFNEIRIFKEMDHLYIIKYYDYIIKNEYLFIIMEYAAGGDLQKIVKKNLENGTHIKENQIWIWFLQICQALKYIHLKKILHRDIKTQNIFLDENKNIKLGDFGISKKLENTTDYAITSIGTPFFLPPEMCNGEKYNMKADIWMLGCVLYELCSLKKPFKGDNMIALINNIKKDEIPDIPPMYSNEMKEMVKLLTKKDDSKRPYIREILELDLIIKKMNENKIEDIDSPYSNTISPNYQIKSIQSPYNIPENGLKKKKLSDLNLDTKLFNNNSLSNIPNNIPSTNNDKTERFRKKIRVPEKINKKYESVGNQKFENIMNDISLCSENGMFLKNQLQTPTDIKLDIHKILMSNQKHTASNFNQSLNKDQITLNGKISSIHKGKTYLTY